MNVCIGVFSSGTENLTFFLLSLYQRVVWRNATDCNCNGIKDKLRISDTTLNFWSFKSQEINTKCSVYKPKLHMVSNNTTVNHIPLCQRKNNFMFYLLLHYLTLLHWTLSSFKTKVIKRNIVPGSQTFRNETVRVDVMCL